MTYEFKLGHLGNTPFAQPIARQIWENKYQYRTAGQVVDATLDDTWRRVANGLARGEDVTNRAGVADLFYSSIRGFELLPAGRILSGCGTKRQVTLANTFVMRDIPDSVEGIMDVAKEAALTMKMGGGLGFDFSTLRPKGATVKGLDCPAAGPLAAMDICDSVCKMVVSGMGRGAMMATLRCDHPDIEDFVCAKSDRSRFRNFNLSVQVSDAFMTAVEQDADWDLIWQGRVVRTIRAAQLWDTIMGQNYAAAEPGVLFIDRINDLNPLNYRDVIAATNSCAEQPLPPNGTCPLASINLARLVHGAFSKQSSIDLNRIRALTAVAVRMLDNALDVSRFALPAQRDMAQRQRRIGIGVTGVGDALAMLGVRYGSGRAAFMVGRWMQVIQNEAYRASALLAAERGVFADYDTAQHLQQPCIRTLDPDVRALVQEHGLRNGTLTTIAPAGTISMLAGNVSSGIEPIFSTCFLRSITKPDGTKSLERVMDYAVWLHREMFGHDVPLPEAIVTASDLTPDDHLRMQAAAQKWVDSGISKTVNVPEDIAFADFKNIYRIAAQSGCKGCTTYRPNSVTGSVLST